MAEGDRLARLGARMSSSSRGSGRLHRASADAHGRAGRAAEQRMRSRPDAESRADGGGRGYRCQGPQVVRTDGVDDPVRALMPAAAAGPRGSTRQTTASPASGVISRPAARARRPTPPPSDRGRPRGPARSASGRCARAVRGARRASSSGLVAAAARGRGTRPAVASSPCRSWPRPRCRSPGWRARHHRTWPSRPRHG